MADARDQGGMNELEVRLRQMLADVQNGDLGVEQALSGLRDLPYEDIGHTKIDHHRPLRNGTPEIIYGEGKTVEQLVEIFRKMSCRSNVYATRVSEEAAFAVQQEFSEVQYNKVARTLALISTPQPFLKGSVLVVTAGTSDLSVAEEAKVTCEMFGVSATVLSDVGVAGIHRLFDHMDEIREAAVLIVVAGMEGALASVIGGLVEQPVIAVPTSVGYGASFSGLSALLGMLTSCASGISVVNIDNGFGAGCAAYKIIRMLE